MDFLEEIIRDLEMWKLQGRPDLCNFVFSMDAEDSAHVCFGDTHWSLRFPGDGSRRFHWKLIQRDYGDRKPLPAACQRLLQILGNKCATPDRSLKSLLDTMQELSFLLHQATSTEEKDSRKWRTVVDAKLLAEACKVAKEANSQAAIAAASLLQGIRTPEKFAELSLPEFDGWSIPNWTAEDELWALSFRDPRRNLFKREMNAQAVNQKLYLQWCSIDAPLVPNLPSFQYTIAVNEFLQGDVVPLRLGILTDRHISIEVRMLSNSVEVICSQEGVDCRSSLVLGHLLPRKLTELFGSTLRDDSRSPDGLASEGLEMVMKFLGRLSMVCLVCFHERLAEFPGRSACENICMARICSLKVLCNIYEELQTNSERKSEGIGRRRRYLRGICRKDSEEFQRLLRQLLGNERYERKLDYEECLKQISEMKAIRISEELFGEAPALMCRLWCDGDDLLLF